jgi:hypothetical protein
LANQTVFPASRRFGWFSATFFELRKGKKGKTIIQPEGGKN